jgi:hypothetical protein
MVIKSVNSETRRYTLRMMAAEPKTIQMTASQVAHANRATGRAEKTGGGLGSLA